MSARPGARPEPGLSAGRTAPKLRPALERELAAVFHARTEAANAYGNQFVRLWTLAGESVRGGKMLRPFLFLDMYDALGSVGSDSLSVESDGSSDCVSIVSIAAAIELLHYSFLLHDDVIDEDDVPSCVDENDDRLVSASSDVFATDRHTAEAVNDPKYVPPSAGEKSGLINKWPFDAEKKNYSYWDGLLGEAVNATYDGTETLAGLETYRYHVLIEDVPAEVVTDVEGVYSQDKYLWIDPTTGSIINQTQHEVRDLKDGSTLLDMQLAFTEDQVSGNVSDAKDSGKSLALLTQTIPLVGFIAGGISILAGVFLFLQASRREQTI